MAEQLSRILGTEQDKVNCSFFFKIGACRHGEKCDRRHNRPPESTTILFPNMLQLPASRFSNLANEVPLSREEMEAFDDFYQDIFVEVSKYGEVEEMIICANPGAHLNGNVYIKFKTEQMSVEVLNYCNGRIYDGRVLKGELSPVTEFSGARCRQYTEGECDRKMCNFIHLVEPNRRLKRKLFEWQDYRARQKRLEERRSRQREVHSDPFGRNVVPDDKRRDDDRDNRDYDDRRDRDRDRDHDHDKGRDRDRDRDYDKGRDKDEKYDRERDDDLDYRERDSRDRDYDRRDRDRDHERRDRAHEYEKRERDREHDRNNMDDFDQYYDKGYGHEREKDRQHREKD